LSFTGSRYGAVTRKINFATALDLGQLFPPFFTAAREDFSSPGGPFSGQKAMLVTTFSLGRLVCSFHEARIIVKFVWNIQPFVFFLLRRAFPPPLISFSKNIFVSAWTKKIFVVESFRLFLCSLSRAGGEHLFWPFLSCG